MNHHEIEIRPTTIDDIPKMRIMHARSWRDTYPNEEHGVSKEWVEERTARWLTPEALEDSRVRFGPVYNDPRHFHRIALKDGQVVGIVHGSKNDKGQHLEAIYIDKELYGTGLAKRLMEQVLEWFDRSLPIALEAVTYNERAKAFYRKYGFEEKTGSEHLFAEKMPVIVMERKGEK
jgi:ribosomal protein S18 acetylase RimI-like enzyme